MKSKKVDLLRSKNFVILIGGKQDEKLKEDFLSFFNIKNYKVYDIGKGNVPALKKKHVPVVLCTYDKEKCGQTLKSAGMRYKKEYVLAEDLFESIDLDVMRDCRKLYAYVGGMNFRDRIDFCYQLFIIMHHIGREDIEDHDTVRKIEKTICYVLMFFIENLFRKKVVFIKNLDNASITKKDFICVNSDKEENDKMLYQEGIVKGRKVYTIQMLERYCFASRLLRKTYFDKRQNECKCVLPYEMFYINPDGNVWLCPCFGELTVSDLIGNSAEEAWNSTIAKIMRLSVENNTYTFCDRRCKDFWKKPDGVELLERKSIKLPAQPSKIMIAFDRACNLRCRSCRVKPYVKNCYEKEQTILHYADVINKSGWLDNCDKLTIGGDGETFLSKGYKKVLFEDASKIRKKVNIMTNGTLFTPGIWEQLEGKYEHISMSISVDAVTEATYKKLRGGSFKQLMKNMEFLSELRKEGKVDFVQVNMIVQEGNYKEMKDFVLWAKKLGFDRAYLSPIWNWGTYLDSEFKRISIFADRGERKMKAKVKECLKDEVFSDPIVLKRWSRG